MSAGTNTERSLTSRGALVLARTTATILLLVGSLVFPLASSALGAASSCSSAMTQLLKNVKRPAAATEGITASAVVRSLAGCSNPRTWRAQANRVGIAAALGPLLHDPTLETDRALDRLCSVFDAYQRTKVCKHHLDQ